MSARLGRITQGPSWTEVFLGALLSLVLGVVLGALLLMLRPVEVVKQMPKDEERDPKLVYYLPGSRNTAKGAEAAAKRKAFAEGQSVTITEDELNTLAGPQPILPAANPPKGTPNGPAPKPVEKPGAASSETLATGNPNFRLHDTALQVGVPVTVNVLGLSRLILVQADGGFAKEGDAFAYQPETIYVGSCPLSRLPFVAGYVRNKFLSPQAIPDDIKASWMKLANVSIENQALKLTMP